MQIILSPTADNGSTYIVLAEFTETLSDGTIVDVIPSSIKWSLTDKNREEINGRTDVPIEPPAQKVAAVCYGDDILLSDGEERQITFNCVYNSLEFGNNLPLQKTASFLIDDEER